MENNIFSYTKRDYERSRQEGLAKIPILSNGNWTDLNATDPGIIILDYVHALVDMINYYQDHQALETFITTAKERANIFRLAKQLCYEIQSAKGAVCDVTFSSVLRFDHPVKIPRGTKVSTSDGIVYLTIQDAYLPTREASVVVPCQQGTPQTASYIGTGISKLSNIDNAKDQSLILNADNIDIDSISVVDSNNRVWKRVDYIVFASSDERAYAVDLNPDNSVTIKFGDGRRGRVPRDSDVLTISYTTSLAGEGRVGANAINTLISPIIDNGYQVELLVNNNQASTGGSSVQSSSEIRELAPGAIKAQGRAVTLSDFENLALLVDGVASAKAYDINTAPTLCLHHEVKVLITPKNDTGSEDALKEQVTKYLSSRMIPPTNLQVFLPSKIAIDIDIVVKEVDFNRNGGLEYDIIQAVKDYFSARSGEIGENFYPSDLSAKISSIDGVRYVVSISPSTVQNISEFSLAVLGNLNLSIQ